MKSKIAITIGDFNGIGPEVVLKSLQNTNIRRTIDPVLLGSFDIFSQVNKSYKLRLPLVAIESIDQKIKKNEIPVLHVHPANHKNIQYGKVAPDAGVCAGISIEKAISLCLGNSVDAMVTAPVSKEAMVLAGYSFPGQTEMLAMLTRSEKVTMMFSSERLKIALATVHVPLHKVPELITVDRLVDKLETVKKSLQGDFGIQNPTIAVLGLNPHAGEHGHLGAEETTAIIPALKKAKDNGLQCEGPFSADGFFASKQFSRYDAVLAMYHDQGLIPLKLLGFESGVNYSAGLKVIRTSPDHGTAFDIAGKGKADVRSMVSAVQLAHSIVQRRKK